MGTMSGGAKLDAYLKAVVEKVGKAQALSVGFLENSTYVDGTSLPMVAAIQEFGAPSQGIPPRPFMRATFNEHSKEWGPLFAERLRAHDYDVAAALRDMGESIASQIQETIFALQSPPLSPVTLMLRSMKAKDPGLVVTGATVGEAAARVAAGKQPTGLGAMGSKPLVASGHLSNSVGWAVEDGSGGA